MDSIFDAVNFEKKKADDFSKKEVLEKICGIFSSYFGKTSVIFCYNVSGFDFEKSVVNWCALHNEKCGFKTNTFAESKQFCIPVKTLQNVFVFSFLCGKKGFSCEQEIFLEQVLRQVKSRFIEWEYQFENGGR